MLSKRFLSAAIGVLALFAAVLLSMREEPTAAPRVAAAAVVQPKKIVPPPPPAEPAPPPAAPSAETPPLVESGEADVEKRVRVLAAELASMWTRDPDQLVSTVEYASRTAETSPSVSLLLAIAHAETNGKILDVSEAGAVGLAQATPVAYLQEGFSGPLYVTPDYLVGARAYIMKKPLGDADTIASMLVKKRDAASRRKARRLLEAARDLRLEGVDELELLRPYAPALFYTRIAEADEHNKRALDELERLIEKGNEAQLKAYRDRTRREYRALLKLQRESWTRYYKELAAKRDAILAREFGGDLDVVKKTRAYEAGEILGRELDERFAPTAMATFLVRHLERKATQARDLGVAESRVDEITAALYNGGSPNVRRMLAGLMSSLPETQKYMKKVPATARRLEARLGHAQGTSLAAR
jgi:hypothetical protein